MRFQLVGSVAIILNIVLTCIFPGYYCLLCVSHWFLDGACCPSKLLDYKFTPQSGCSCCYV